MIINWEIYVIIVLKTVWIRFGIVYQPLRITGIVKFYNDSKGFGYIKDADSSSEYYVNSSGITNSIKENDKVSFEI